MEFFSMPMPEEIRKQMQAEADKREMIADTFRHDVQRLFEELSLEHLSTLRMMLHQMVMNDDLKLVAYYEGINAAALQFRFPNYCPGCATTHDPGDLFHGQEPESEGVKSNPDQPVFAPDYIENLRRYHVTPVSEQSREVKCTGVTFDIGECGMTWVSLEDRMLRDPDECPGCIQRTKWG